MNYDKNAFIAGIAVGRQLKGWATERINSNGEISASMSTQGETVIVLNPRLVLPVSGFTEQVMTAFAYITTSEIDVDIGEISPPIAQFGTEQITLSIAKEITPTFEDSFTVANPTLDGTITASATLEVIT